MPFVTQKSRELTPVENLEQIEIDVPVDPTFGEITGAAFRKENSAVSAYTNGLDFGRKFTPVFGYDPFRDLEGYEPWADNFFESTSPAETALIKQKIDRELEDRKLLEDSGWAGFGAQMLAGVTDPAYLASLATGAGLLNTGKTALQKTVSFGVIGGVSELPAETLKQLTQETRTFEEGAINVAGATFLSGVLGGSLHGLSQLRFNRLAKQTDDMLHGPPKPVVPGEDVVKISSENKFDLVNAGKIEQFKVSPLIRTQTSESLATKEIASQMMETPLVSKGNVEGIATAPTGGSVETRIKLWDTNLAEGIDTLSEAYKAYRGGGKIKQTAQNMFFRRGEKLPFREFREEIGRAMRRGDVHDIPEVALAAKEVREKVFNPLKDKAIAAGLLPEDVSVDTAVSYLTRIYNHKKIIAKRGDWSALVTKWLNGVKKEAIDQIDTGAKVPENTTATAKLNDTDIEMIVDQITDNILGNPSGRNAYAPVSLARGPLKERTFNIPDELIEDFIESDIDLVTRQYLRTMAPDVEMTNMFGRTDMEDQITRVIDDYNAKIKEATTEKKRTKLNNRREADIRDLEAMRDRLLGNYKMPADPNSFFIRAGRTLRDINFMRMLGGMTLSAIPDMARPIAVNGLRPVAKGLLQLAKSPARFKMAREEAKKAAVGLDMVLNSRAASLAEVSDVYARGTSFERGLRASSDVFSKMTLMSQWNAAMKQFSGVVTSDRLLSVALDSASGTIKKNDLRRLASAGIGQPMAKRIAKQFEKHGDEGTIKLSNGHLWDDNDALQTFRAAVLKDVDRTIVTPGKGEAPLWTSSETGKLIFQFKTFASSAHHKITLADLQHADSAALTGFMLSVALGSLTYGLKEYVAGRKITDDTTKMIVESLDRSGGFGYFWDVNNMLEKSTRGSIGVNPLIGGNPMSRYASRNVTGALLGPSLGTAEDIIQTTGAISSGDFRRKDLHTLRKLMPGQNLFYMRVLLNQLEEKAARRLPR